MANAVFAHAGSRSDDAASQENRTFTDRDVGREDRAAMREDDEPAPIPRGDLLPARIIADGDEPALGADVLRRSDEVAQQGPAVQPPVVVDQPLDPVIRRIPADPVDAG